MQSGACGSYWKVVFNSVNILVTSVLQKTPWTVCDITILSSQTRHSLSLSLSLSMAIKEEMGNFLDVIRLLPHLLCEDFLHHRGLLYVDRTNWCALSSIKQHEAPCPRVIFKINKPPIQWEGEAKCRSMDRLKDRRAGREEDSNKSRGDIST